ncbi:hypothetical protein GCM10027403_24760 [Arthrobacter tecti]
MSSAAPPAELLARAGRLADGGEPEAALNVVGPLLKTCPQALALAVETSAAMGKYDDARRYADSLARVVDDRSGHSSSRVRAMIVLSQLAWLEGHVSETWTLLADAHHIAASPVAELLVTAARAAAELRAERYEESIASAETAISRASGLGDALAARARDDAAVTLASCSATRSNPDEGQIAELDRLSNPATDLGAAARTRAINNSLVALLGQENLPAAAAWSLYDRAHARARLFGGKSLLSIARQGMDLAARTGEWERGWAIGTGHIETEASRSERVAIAAKLAQFAFARGLVAEAASWGRRARSESTAIDVVWVRVYAYLGGVVAAAASGGSVEHALNEYRNCMSPTSHAQRAGRAWEAAEVALTAGTDAAVVVRFLERVVPGGAVDNLWPATKAYAQAVLKDHSGVEASSGELVAVRDRIGYRNAVWRATLQAQLVCAYRREGRHTAAALALAEGQRLVDRWPGRLRDELHQLSVTEVSQPPALSTRQAQILELILEGASNRNISETLSIAERTVAVHVSEILARTGHASRTALAVAELRRRLTG